MRHPQYLIGLSICFSLLICLPAEGQDVPPRKEWPELSERLMEGARGFQSSANSIKVQGRELFEEDYRAIDRYERAAAHCEEAGELLARAHKEKAELAWPLWFEIHQALKLLEMGDDELRVWYDKEFGKEHPLELELRPEEMKEFVWVKLKEEDGLAELRHAVERLELEAMRSRLEVELLELEVERTRLELQLMELKAKLSHMKEKKDR